MSRIRGERVRSFLYLFINFINIDIIRLPDPNIMTSDIPREDLPKCEKENCKGLLRPHIVWFGENLDEYILEQACKYFFIYTF